MPILLRTKSIANNMWSTSLPVGNTGSGIFTVQTPRFAIQKCCCLLQIKKLKIQWDQRSERGVTWWVLLISYLCILELFPSLTP